MQDWELHTMEATALVSGPGSCTVCSGDGQTEMMRAGGMVLPPLKLWVFSVSFTGTLCGHGSAAVHVRGTEMHRRCHPAALQTHRLGLPHLLHLRQPPARATRTRTLRLHR